MMGGDGEAGLAALEGSLLKIESACEVHLYPDISLSNSLFWVCDDTC